MLHWAMALLVVALGTAIVGFGGLIETLAPAARTICIVALGLLLASAVAQMLRPRY